MHPLARQITIGLVVSLCVIGAALATWFTATHNTDDSLAARLPASAVLAYVEFSPGDLPLLTTLPSLAPALELPSMHPDTTALAFVHLENGIEGWVGFRRADDGTVHVEQTHPAMDLLFTNESPSLASDWAFKTLRWDDALGWGYFAFPRLLKGGSVLESVLTLQDPMAFRLTASGITLRQPLKPTPRLAPWTGRPLVTIQGAATTVVLPPWNSLTRLGELLTPDARIIAETLAGSLLEDIAPGISLRYDVSLLLGGTSLFQSGLDGSGASVFALEGQGTNTRDVDRVLRSLHERFASAHGGSATVKTVSAEGFTLQTMLPADEHTTTETREGAWTILETPSDGAVLSSAHDGSRFVVTTLPGGVTRQAEGASPLALDRSTIRWSPELSARLAPLWPNLLMEGEPLRFRLTEGPGYVEWTKEGS